MQEELNKLRRSTSQGLGGENAPSNVQAPSGNLTNLGSTLNNLNQTLNRLNQTLGQLRGTAAAPSRTATTTSTGGPIPVPFGGGQASQRIFNESLQAYSKIQKDLWRTLGQDGATILRMRTGMWPKDVAYEALFGTSKGPRKKAYDYLGALGAEWDQKKLNFNRHLASSWIKSQGIPNYFRETFVQSEY